MKNLERIRNRFKRHFPKKSALFLVAALALIIWLAIKPAAQKSQIKEPQAAAPTQNPSSQSSEPQAAAAVQNYLEGEVKKLKGDYSIYIKNLETGETFALNQNKRMTLASVYKLAVMYKTYDQLQKGTVKGEDKILDTTISEALNRMITISDNETAIALAQKFGWGQVDSFIKKEGAANFNVNTNEPNADAVSVSVILEKIYFNQAVSKTASGEMLNLLLAQKINDRIPKLLPKETKVAHKTGELDNTRNDAGIIFGKKSDYVFVFLTNTPVPEAASESIAKLSKGAFDLLEAN